VIYSWLGAYGGACEAELADPDEDVLVPFEARENCIDPPWRW
jgi:hypothetical protein